MACRLGPGNGNLAFVFKCLPHFTMIDNRRLIPSLVLAALLFGMLGATTAFAAKSAVILMYHRFGEDGFPTTNIRLDQFEAHIAELKSGGYTVLPLPEINAALNEGRSLPDRTVAITIDDAYESVFTEAFPRLKAAGFPFTLFVATLPIDRGAKGYMNWDQIRALRDAGGTIGSQTHSHPHMPLLSDADNLLDLEISNRRFEKELGKPPNVFAYPYGEASSAVIGIVREQGFVAAFGQHSGVVHRSSNRHYLPRFALNESYGDLKRFRLIANALPLPVSEITPSDPQVGQNPPAFGFTVAPSVSGLHRLSCYRSSEGKVKFERLGARRIEVRFDKPFAQGRTRVNCTMPGQDGRWRWFGMQFYVKPG